MYDYMKALQRQFETKPRSIQELSAELDRTHKELSSRLAKEDRKLLLRLVDMEDNLRGHATLHSFTCGYRLACGIHRELTEEPAYSFAREEEERACRKAQAHDETDLENTNT
ncbi:DUF6809 family protein [Intestinimonas butyriciproducens]|uniref:DUF6809 family protein n=1 Tax=Intestinimonas butyriciproducens TaxID=1297617 RepID=UPI003AF0B058